MLDEFIDSNREAILERTRARVGSRTFPKPTVTELANGIPVFLDQLGDALRRSSVSEVADHEQISNSAGRHGHELLRTGLTIAQVVHDYADVCQVITELAVQQNAPVSGEEFRTLNLCLDDAIAGAVTAFSKQREGAIARERTERLGVLAHELRNLLNTAVLSFESIRRGAVAPGGSTGVVLGRSLMGLRDLIDRSLADVQLDAGIKTLEITSVAELVEEVEIGALVQAQARAFHIDVTSVDRRVTIEGDRQILAGALSNLLQNAFKFSPREGHVSLTIHATAERVLFDVEDECGGLPPGQADVLVRPFEQRGPDRSGVGLGLSICRKAASANGGEVRVRDLPGKGCVFTLDLPRKAPPALSATDGGKRRSEAPEGAIDSEIGTARVSDKPPNPERAHTDESLRLERAKADHALGEEVGAVDEAADAVISKARARADHVLATARAKTDRQARATDERATESIERKRGLEDQALAEERADADETVRSARAEHVALLSIERDETDKDLFSERARSDDAVATRDEFLGIVSHDLRNILSSIVGFAGLIAKGVRQENHVEKVFMQAERIQRSSARMNRLIGDLVDVASIEAGVLAVTREVGDPTHVVTEAVDTLQAQASASGITLAAETPSPSSPVAFDPARILQVLTNLLSNAIKFTPRNGKVSVHVERIADELRFAVSDTGEGIPADKLDAIFDRFGQVTKNDRRGVGLGLYISKCIVQGHAGRIWAESRIGVGSTFYFTLPIQVAA